MVNPKISLICAMDENRVIGNKNRIPWHIKDDLLHFKHLTLHHTVIMGRTTFDSLMKYYEESGRPIPERNHIIVSRDTSYSVTRPNCFVNHSIEDALIFAKTIEKEEVFVSGGASIFKQTIDKADILHLTIVHGTFEGDTYFPDYSAFTKILKREDKQTIDGLSYSFIDLGR